MRRLSVDIFQFFVAVDYDTKDDRLWYEKYSIRKPMLPSFISMELGTKVSVAMYIKIIYTCKVKSACAGFDTWLPALLATGLVISRIY